METCEAPTSLHARPSPHGLCKLGARLLTQDTPWASTHPPVPAAAGVQPRVIYLGSLQPWAEGSVPQAAPHASCPRPVLLTWRPRVGVRNLL